MILLPPPDLFARRALRLEQLAAGHALSDFLLRCAALCHRQQALRDGPASGWRAMLDALSAPFAGLAAVERALASLLALSDDELDTIARELTHGRYRPEAPHFAALPLMGAALQVQAARQPPAHAGHEAGHCPRCGGLPLASVLSRGESGHAVRHLECSLCAARWPMSRAQCTACGDSEKLQYLRQAGHDDCAAPAQGKDPHEQRALQEVEACGHCRGALKQVSLLKDPAAEAAADDLASLALDLLAGEAGYQKLGFNPLFLA